MLWKKLFTELYMEQERAHSTSRVSTRKVGISEKNISDKLSTELLALALPAALPRMVTE